MELELRDHQKKALEKLKNGSILCGGVGSGKSITSLAYFYEKECSGSLEDCVIKDPKDLYIITTARKRDTKEWEAECEPFGLSTVRRDSTNYIRVTIDSWNNIQKYIDVKDAFFIFDEQRVVGYGAWVKAFIKITKSNRWILLSATPGDTWSDYIPVFIANGFYRNKTDFISQHAVYSRYSKFPKIDKYINTGKLVQYRKQILVDMKFERHTVRHVEIIIADYDRSLYSVLQKNRWNIFEDRPVRDISELCYSMRRVVNCDPDRVEKLKDLLTKHPKVIIFYNFNYELEILRDVGKELGITVAEWNGHKHEPVPSTESWIYLVQYAAGAEGWNCITTDTIIFYSQSYSYKATVQASGRIDRLNTPFTDLYYYHLRSNSSIDLAIAKTLRKKEDFNERSFIKERK